MAKGDWLAVFSLNMRHSRKETLVKSICETVQKSLFWVPTCVSGFEYTVTRHDWSVKKAIVDPDEQTHQNKNALK